MKGKTAFTDDLCVINQICLVEVSDFIVIELFITIMNPLYLHKCFKYITILSERAKYIELNISTRSSSRIIIQIIICSFVSRNPLY